MHKESTVDFVCSKANWSYNGHCLIGNYLPCEMCKVNHGNIYKSLMHITVNIYGFLW